MGCLNCIFLFLDQGKDKSEQVSQQSEILLLQPTKYSYQQYNDRTQQFYNTQACTLQHPFSQISTKYQYKNSIISQKNSCTHPQFDNFLRRETTLPNSYQKDDNQWQQDCINYGFDLISLNNQKETQQFALLFQNIQFYFDKKNMKKLQSQEQSRSYEVEGIIYKTDYDQNKNPTFTIQKGIFLVNLEKKKFLLDGSGVEYCGKSEIIKHNGIFKKGKLLNENKINNNENQILNKKQHQIIIIDTETGEQVNQKRNIRKLTNQVLQIWCKYNQQISIDDIAILDYKRWMTSSIIDSYVLHLNLEGEENYFKQNQQERNKIKRILFLPSSLTTNFGYKYDNKKAEKLIKQELLEYSQMNLEITKIYKKIGLPINERNYHWYFLLFDAESETVEIFDSTSKQNYQNKSNEQLITTLRVIFKISIKQKKIHEESGQQRDGYSCGYHICNFMKFCFEKQFNKNISYKYDESKMISILKKILEQ